MTSRCQGAIIASLRELAFFGCNGVAFTRMQGGREKSGMGIYWVVRSCGADIPFGGGLPFAQNNANELLKMRAISG